MRECAVSDMYGFGVDEELTEPQSQGAKEPKWFRERMDKVSEQMRALQERNDALEAAQRQTQVAEALTAKGYSPTAAGLFTGTPDKLDDWLGAHGAALAKTDGNAVEPGQGVQGTPQTVVSPESQAALQALAAAGQGGAAVLSGDDQLAALIAAAKDDSELDAILRSNGSKFV